MLARLRGIASRCRSGETWMDVTYSRGKLDSVIDFLSGNGQENVKVLNNWVNDGTISWDRKHRGRNTFAENKEFHFYAMSLGWLLNNPVEFSSRYCDLWVQVSEMEREMDAGETAQESSVCSSTGSHMSGWDNWWQVWKRIVGSGQSLAEDRPSR